MARSGITKSQVRAIRDGLLAQGLHPSVDAVRHGLGDVGSKSTIHRLLRELREEEEGGDAPGMRREDTAGALAALVEQLADRLHADAEGRMQALRQEQAQALADKDRELAALREKVRSLAEQVELLQSQPPFAAAEAEWSPPRSQHVPYDTGFGSFDSMLLSSRSSGRQRSPFETARSAARSWHPTLPRTWPRNGR
nr:DNA-binding protein [Massilia sp. YIM B02763]